MPGFGTMPLSEAEKLRCEPAVHLHEGPCPSPERPFWLMQAECAFWEMVTPEPGLGEADIAYYVQEEVLTAAVRIDEFTYDSFAVLGPPSKEA